MTQKTFQFVDGLEVNSNSKKLVRRHVMMGKNSGKKIHRPSRRDLNNRPGPSPAIFGRPAFADTAIVPFGDGLQEDEDALIRNWRCVAPNTISRHVGNGLITLSVPVQLTSYALHIVNQFFNFVADHIYPVQLGMSAWEAKCLWMNVLFSDETAYRCTIALMQACNEIFLGTGASSTRALYHLSETFAHVNKMLQGEHALSDSSLAIVISLINQEQIRNEQKGVNVHMNGLKRMIELRGGLTKLAQESNAIALKICKTDILCCLQQGGPTTFFRDEMHQVRRILGERDLGVPREESVAAVRHADLDPDLRQTLVDVIEMCFFFNKNLPGVTMEIWMFLEVQVSVCYRLIRFHELGSPWSGFDSIHIAYHTALTLFMMSMFLQYDRQRVMDYGVITRCHRYAIEDASLGDEDDELNLWVMVIGGIWISAEDHVNFLAPKMRVVARRQGISTWDGMLGVVTRFPWIHAIHDEPGQKLWKRVFQAGAS